MPDYANATRKHGVEPDVTTDGHMPTLNFGKIIYWFLFTIHILPPHVSNCVHLAVQSTLGPSTPCL